MRHIRINLVGAAISLLVVAACGGGSPATSAAPTAAAATVPVTTQAAIPTPVPGVEGTAEGVCAAMTEPLVEAALGAPADEPQFGDVAGGDGVYCYFQAAGDSQDGVEVQFDTMTQLEFNDLAETLGAGDPFAGVGQSAFTRAGAYTGGPGATLLAWHEGQSATVLIERDGDQEEMTAAAKAIAASVLEGN